MTGSALLADAARPGLALAVALLAASALAAPAPAGPAPWLIPEVNAAQHSKDSDEAAWRLFIALNWPAKTEPRSQARLADPQAPLGADRPVVWETWKNINETLRPDGADPGPWDAVSSQDPAARFEALSAADLPKLRHIVAGRMVPVTAPLLHPEKLIEVRFSRASFEYIRARELYCLDGQLRLLAEGEPARFPNGAIQVKASWRPIGPAQRSRYHTLTIARPDGSPALYGLTALNIAVKGSAGVGPAWLWAAFEHEDTAQRPGAEGWQLPSHDSFACPGTAAGCDHAPRGIGLEGTVWEHYRLRGTLTTYLDADGLPQRLASSELEAGLQDSSSCTTCHSRATIGQTAGTGAVTRLPVFQSTAADAPRRGYVGLPDPAWYRSVDDSGALEARYAGLDFVWSLARAAPRAQATTHRPGGSP